MPVNLIPLSMIILFLWLFFLFIFLGTTADEYFCPSLIVMSQLLKLNQNLAGVTLLALGNGAPDIFSAFAAITNAEDGNAGLAIGALFGAGMFVTSIVTGAVSIYKPFTLTQRPFMRDVIFYIFAVYLTFFVLWTNTVQLYQAIIFVGMYVLYVFVVFVGRVLYQKVIKKKILGRGDIPRPPPRPEGEEMTHDTSVARDNADDENNEELNTSSHPLPTRGPQFIIQEDTPSPPAHDDTPLLSSSSRQNYSAIIKPPIVTINDGLESSLRPAPVVRLTDIREEDENGLTVSLPASLSPPPEQEGIRPAGAQSHRQLPITDLDEDDDDTYQAKLLAMQQEARRRRKIRRTISGALDITEDLGVAILGSENLSRACDHVPSTPQPSTPVQSRRTSSAPGLPNISNFLNALRESKTPKKPHPFWKMLKAIWPLDEDFKTLRWYYKIMEVCKIPSSMILALTVPVVDYDEDDHKWNRWLNVMHCVTGPLTMSLLIHLDSGPLGFLLLGNVLPLWSLVLCAGIVLALVVVFTSQNDKPPKYHGPVFSLLGFVSAIVWIYVIANEIVALLQAMGVVMKMSDAVLGLTLLAWGNSIGDAISNFTMAKQGFPRMAISACFGGPLLSIHTTGTALFCCCCKS
jgi:sodium/potassium/calcium exchanger 6